MKVVLVLFAALMMLASGAQAQPYAWRQSFVDTLVECVTVNPLSGGRTLYVGTQMQRGIQRTDDGGASWVTHWEGMNEFSGAGIFQILCVPSDTSVLLAITSGQGLYRSTNGGRSWRVVLEEGGALGEALTYHRGDGMMGGHVGGERIYYGQYYTRPVWYSTDRGATWDTLSANDSLIVLCTISASQDAGGTNGSPVILAGSGEGGIARSTDAGVSWHEVVSSEDPDEVIRPEVPKIVWSAHAPWVSLATRWLSNDSSLMRSRDHGLTWEVFGPNLSRSWALEVDQRRELTDASSGGGSSPSAGPKRMWLGLFNRGIAPIEGTTLLETNDGGETWVSAGLPELGQVWMIKYDTVSGLLAAATSDGLFVAEARGRVHGSGSDRRWSGVQGLGVRWSEHPARGIVRVVFEEPDVRTENITLHDVAGRVIARVEGGSVDAGLLPEGVYWARVFSSAGSSAMCEHWLKLIVSR